uniref:Calcyon neuron specific vesicular protein n=1 Tax=Canis lupus familiaris TaxID=9615 RepID=A0A8P0PFV7_CANLF
MSPTWQLPALGPRGDPWAGCRVSASPACGLPGPWEHSWVRSACTPGGSRATPPGGPPPGEQPGALARGRLLHTGVLGGSRVLGDSVRLLASCPRAQHKHHCSPPPRVPPRGATARPPPGDPDPQPRRPHRIPELRPQGRPLSKPPGPGDPESWAGAPAPRPGPHRLGPPGEKCLLRGRPTAPSAVAVVWGSGGCRKAPHPVLCPCRSLTDPRGPYWLEHCPLPLHPPMPLAKGAPRRGQSRGRGRGAGGTHPSGSCSGAPTLPSVLTRPWKRVGRCVLRGLHRAEDHTGQGTPPAGGSRGDWATPGAESGPRWPEEGPALEPPCSRLSTGRATKRCHGERPAVCCREGGASPDLVVIKTQTEYQLSSPDQPKKFPDLEAQKLACNHPEEGRRLPTARMIAFAMALLGCVLIMYKAIWYDQFTCPDGFLLRHKICTPLTLEMYYTEMDPERHRSILAAIGAYPLSRKHGTETPSAWGENYRAVKEGPKAPTQAGAAAGAGAAGAAATEPPGKPSAPGEKEAPRKAAGSAPPPAPAPQ